MREGKIPFIETYIRVSDGSFESRLTVPVNATKEQLENVGRMWMEALLKAVSFCPANEEL